MAYYRATDRSDRAKALAGVLFVHAALGALILAGLNVETVTAAVERLKTFNIAEPPPPHIEEPPPVPDESGAPEEEAAPENVRSRPTPVVAPRPSLPIPLPMTTSERPGPEGTDRTAGAGAVPGAGTGAGGQGSGYGGGGAGGTGTGAGIGSQARLLGGHQTRLSSSFLRDVGVSRGSVPLRLTISPAGRATSCSPLRSSGSARLDAELCRIMTSRSRWAPATDRAGRPISVQLTYIATFSE